MQRLDNPFPLFLDLRGALLDAGSIFVGEPNADPEVAPITVYFDAGQSIVAEQPLRTRGGFIVNGMTPAFVWMEDGDYSVRIRDGDGNEVAYTPSVVTAGVEGGGEATEYQPLDDDLTAIAALLTTSFGRNLLTLANAAALKTAAGVVDGIPTTGGTVTGNLTRSGSGSHLYHAGATMTSGRVFVTASGASDPTSLPGDIWIQHA